MRLSISATSQQALEAGDTWAFAPVAPASSFPVSVVGGCCWVGAPGEEVELKSEKR